MKLCLKLCQFLPITINVNLQPGNYLGYKLKLSLSQEAMPVYKLPERLKKVGGFFLEAEADPGKMSDMAWQLYYR